jgi:hypothetical protein
VDQARIGIEVYEVVFKHADGRIFSASATKDKVISLQLPAANYEAVLLAGKSDGSILLASAYRDDIVISGTGQNIVVFTLEAPKVSVDADVVFTDPTIAAPSGTSQDGFPYFALDKSIWAKGTVTITDFPVVEIFDGNFEDSPTNDFINGVEAVAKLNWGAGFVAAYDSAKAAAITAAADAETAKSAWTNTGADYATAASAAKTAYETLSTAITNLVAAALETPLPIAVSAFGTSFSGISVNGSSALGTLQGLVNTAATAYGVAAAGASGQGTATGEADAASTANTNVVYTAVTGSSATALKTAIDTALTDDIGAVSPLTLDSFGLDNKPLGTLDYGTVPGTGTITFFFKTSAVDGLAKLYYNISVKAFGDASVRKWNLKGGLDNYNIDDGTNSGGSILLAIGPDAFSAGGISGPNVEVPLGATN